MCIKEFALFYEFQLMKPLLPSNFSLSNIKFIKKIL